MIQETPIMTFVGEVNPYEESPYLEEARQRITSQFFDKDVIDRYLQVMLQGKEELQATIKQLMQDRSLDNAKGAQLDIIGEIVGQPRVLFDSEIIRYFGFIGATGASPYRSIDNTTRTYGPWKGINDPLLGTRKLTDTEYRRLIKLKILKNTSDASVTAFVDAVKLLFGLDQLDYDDSLPPNYDEAGAVIAIAIGREYNDPELSVFPGLDEQALAERYLNRPLGVSLAYQDPITFIANFLFETYRIYQYGSSGTQAVLFEDMFTFTRPYTADYYDFTGTLQTAAVDEPRIGYDPNTLDPLGLLINGPDEVLRHTWGVEANDSQGTLRITLVQDENQTEAQVAMVLEASDMKLALFRENSYWKLRVEAGSDTYNMVISQYPNDAITATISYTPNNVFFLIQDESRIVDISTIFEGTDIRTYDMRIGGEFTTSASQTLNHFEGRIEEIIYLRPFVGEGDSVVDGSYITTEEYDKILTENDDYIIVEGY